MSTTAESRIDTLTQQIYQDGLQKAQKDSEKILQQARQQAENIVAEARRQAASLSEVAQKDAENLRNSTRSELQLAGAQFLSHLQSKISGLLADSLIQSQSAKLALDSNFLSGVLLEMAALWARQPEQALDLEISLAPAIAKEMETRIRKELADKAAGLVIRPDSNLKSGFTIARKGESFQLSFTEEDFVQLFKPYLRKKVNDILFQEKP